MINMTTSPNINYFNNKEEIEALRKQVSSCKEQVEKLQRQHIQLLISAGNDMVRSTPKEQKNNGNEFTNARNTFNSETLIRNYGFSPKVIGQVLAKMKQSGALQRTPAEYAKRTGSLKKR